MAMCIVAVKENCVKFVKDKCSNSFKDACVVVKEWKVNVKEVSKLISWASASASNGSAMVNSIGVI
ncbi:hypothetical protein L1049_001527 [Liquidambar formosana]|uniref:Uncharacterized protein n=1 Tax=Liquidambar formosana TaxID=63359 RepID=A0AAP0NEV9_LIQFO